MTILPVQRGDARMVRRFLTLMFSDLTGSTSLSEALEAEHYAALLGQLRDAYQTVIARHGGIVVRIQGDGMLAIFGHPEALEDDGRRATEAALDLHALVRTLRIEPQQVPVRTLTLHSGIHAGLVLLGQGDMTSGRFELMGNAANIAARLSDVAGPGEILVSEETLGAERHFFVTGERRELALQGTARPLAALPIVERAHIGSRYEARSQRGLSAFVGRQAELAILDEAFQDTLAGRTRSVAVVAAAGLGKTRMAREFLDRCGAAGGHILRGYCEHYGGTQPLQPFLQMLRTQFGLEHGRSVAELAQRVDAGLADIPLPMMAGQRAALLQALSLNDPVVESATRQAPQTMLSALAALIVALAARRSLVLFIDDWQWADEASYQVLNELRAQQESPLLVLLATRGFGLADAAMEATFQVIELRPLSNDEALQTAHRLLPAADPFLLGEICAYAGGSPLYIEELCHSAADGPTPQRPGHVQGGAAWLRVLIEARVTRLPEAQAALVRSAAVVGAVIPTWLFERITGCPAGDPRVAALAREDLIYPGEQTGTLRFKHGITRDAVYEAVGLHQRKALHLQIAHALLDAHSVTASAESTFEALAYHFDAAGRPAEAAHYAELAGDKAVAASALYGAQAQYRKALVALDRLEATPARALRWSAIMLRLSLASVFHPSRNDLPLFERALELAGSLGDPLAVARAQYWLSYLRYVLGDSLEAVDQAECALTAASACGDNRLLVQVQATLGQALAAVGRYGPALTLLDAAIGVKQRHRSGAALPVGLAYSLACKAYALGDRGDFAAAWACFDEAMQSVGTTQHEIGASVRGLYGATLLWQGRWADAQAVATEAWRIGERTRSLFTMSMGRAVAAYASWKLEPNEQALRDMLDTLAWLTPRGNALFTSLNHGWLVDALTASKRPAAARWHAAQALRRGRQCDLIGVAMACRAMATLAADNGSAARARRWIARALDLAAIRGSAHEHAVTLLRSAEVELKLTRSAPIAPLLDEAEAGFAAMGMHWHLAKARLLRANAPSAAELRPSS